MGIRPARTIRNRFYPAWTRFSKKKVRKSYIKAMPHRHLTQFRMGTKKEDYNAVFHLVSEDDVVLRDNALEAARQTANKLLEKSIAGNYYFMIRVYPHHVIRENKMLAGAGADRLQKGMARSFGKPTHVAARVKKGKQLLTIKTYKNNEKIAKEALKRAMRKLSGRYKIVAG